MPNKRVVISEGEIFGKLKAINQDGKRNHGGHILWLCVCACGKYKLVKSSNLKNGSATSCGCSQYKYGKNKTHNLCNHTLYSIWSGIKKRCYSKNSDKFKYYGGRGIFMCDEWKCNFLSFYHWAMDNGWVKGLTIERKKVNEWYCPSNCKWATMLEQANNKRNNRYLYINGEEITIGAAVKKFGVKYTTILDRLRKGWSHDQCISTEKFSGRYRKPT